MKKIPSFVLILSGLLLFAGGAFAHQPVLVLDEISVDVENPEVSKAYYGQLADYPVVYSIKSDRPFDLYVNLLIPADRDARKDFIIEIRKDGELLEILNGRSFDWVEFFEPYGRDKYLKGPEFEKEVGAGDYEIEVFNDDYSGRYVLAVGSKEEFGLKEIIRASYLLPMIKVVFFEKSPFLSLFNLSGLVWLSLIVVILILFFIVRKMLKEIKRRKKKEA